MIKFNNITEIELLSVQTPPKTASYSPVSHRSFMEAIQEELDKNNLVVSNKNYKVNKGGNQVIATYDIKQAGYSELGMRLAWRNSYDKSMTAALVSGSTVWICQNGMISGEIQYMRKHTGSINQELHGKIQGSINQLEGTFTQHNKDMEAMKNIFVDERKYAEMAGRMFMNDEIITSTQLVIMKKELDEPTYEDFKDNSLWSFYNHATHALKESHSLEYIKRHTNLHQFVEQEYSI
jgi:hypothetical protein